MSRPTRYNSQGGFGKTQVYDDDTLDRMSAGSGEDIDIDFSITESGRTVAHLIANLREDDNMDFSVTSSGRSIEKLVSHVPEGSTRTTAMDFTISHSGRTLEQIVHEEDGEEEEEEARRPTLPPPSQQQQQTPVPGKSPAKAIPRQNGQQMPSSLLGPPPEARSEDSGTSFIHGIMDNITGMLSHTPPSALGTSYETRHFGKRPRSGVSPGCVFHVCAFVVSSNVLRPRTQSVSGRLRSASDLEDKGIIDRAQKGVLKDLIIAGDDALQQALDKYEKGDSSELEGMIKNGALAGRLTSDIDLLGDLDLDFLTVEDPGLGQVGNQNIEAAASIRGALGQITTTTTTAIHNDDAIGDLEFNGDLDDQLLQQSSYDGSRPGEQRFRSNSLAYGILQNEESFDGTHSYGPWMDRDESMKGNHYQNNTRAQSVSVTSPSGIAACLEEYGRSRSESTIKLSKAEERRRDRLLKKEQREREKLKPKPEKRSYTKRDNKKSPGRKPKNDKKGGAGAASSSSGLEQEEIRSGTGRPRSSSDPHLKTSLDENGLLHVERPDGWVGAYSPESRKMRIERFMEKRNHRVWKKSVKYDVRKNFADSRLRVKGRFVKKEDELLMRELMSLT